MKKTRALIGREALLVLKKAIAGQELRGDRYFPFPFMYCTMGVNGKGPATVPSNVIESLVGAGFISAATTSLMQDVIVYRVTDAGRRFAADGSLPPDDSQLDWVGQ